MNEPDVRLETVVKRFDGVVAVDGITLEIPSGSFFALLGPSGCGKTTTLRMIGGFEEPDEGAIYLGDLDVVGLPPYRRDVNTVFQSYALFPHLSIFDNVAFGLRRKGVDKTHVKGRVEQWTPPGGADDHGELVVRVEQVEDVKGDAGKAYPNLLEKAEGTTLRVRVPASAARTLDPSDGASIAVDVRRGREPGVVFAHPEKIRIASK